MLDSFLPQPNSWKQGELKDSFISFYNKLWPYRYIQLVKETNNDWILGFYSDVCVCVCVCLYIYVHIYINMYTGIYVYMCIHTHTHTPLGYVELCVCVCVCVCVFGETEASAYLMLLPFTLSCFVDTAFLNWNVAATLHWANLFVSFF